LETGDIVMIRKRTFLKISFRYVHWFIINLIMAYVLTSVVVQGNALVARAVDKLLAGEHIMMSKFIWQLIIMAFIGLVSAFIKSYSSSTFSVNVQTAFKNESAQKLAKLEYKYFDDLGSGSIINKLISDIAETGRFFSETLPDICTVLITIVTIMIYIAGLNFKLLIVVLLCYPILIIAANLIAKKMVALAKKRRGKLDLMASIAGDSIQGIVVGRSYNLFEVIKNKLDKAIDDIVKNEYQRTTISMGSWVLQQMISWVPTIVCSVFILYQTFSGTVTIGGMMSFMILINRLAHSMSELPFIINDAREMNVSINRLEEIMSQKDEPSGDYFIEESNSNQQECTDAIILKNLIFGYEEGGRKIFDGLDVEIERGKTTAFAGGSGQGKTTVFKILCGFYTQNSGDYYLMGKKFLEWNLSKAREQFALVSQSVFLFPETIAENVAYGRVDATRDEVIEACKRANIHDFIVNLPEKYETLVGERGVRLSGGERQRISIARAFLKNAPILLLDEPTSAIDVLTESLIQDAIDKISENKTVIIIAHRLSTIEKADKICVFADGRIVESGTHDELLHKNGTYSELYSCEKTMTEEDQKALSADKLNDNEKELNENENQNKLNENEKELNNKGNELNRNKEELKDSKKELNKSDKIKKQGVCEL